MSDSVFIQAFPHSDGNQVAKCAFKNKKWPKFKPDITMKSLYVDSDWVRAAAKMQHIRLQTLSLRLM